MAELSDLERTKMQALPKHWVNNFLCVIEKTNNIGRIRNSRERLSMCGAEEVKPWSLRWCREALVSRISRYRVRQGLCSRQAKGASCEMCKAVVGGVCDTAWITEGDGKKTEAADDEVGWHNLALNRTLDQSEVGKYTF
jgi:hypothetical protein